MELYAIQVLAAHNGAPNDPLGTLIGEWLNGAWSKFVYWWKYSDSSNFDDLSLKRSNGFY